MEVKYCSFCGGPHTDLSRWPRHCSVCGQEHWRNPIPVSVLLVPVDEGVLTVRRNIPPGQGLLALPGGFIDWGESWQQAAVRELREETGLMATQEELNLLHIETAGNVMIVFARTGPRVWGDLQFQIDPGEVIEVVKINGPEELAFPTHTEVVQRFFQTRNR